MCLVFLWFFEKLQAKAMLSLQYIVSGRLIISTSSTATEATSTKVEATAAAAR